MESYRAGVDGEKSRGLLRCDCNTQECADAGMTTCIARKSCYTELYQNVLNRGCDPTPLACENRKPSGLQQLEWPALYCCRHKNLCNKHAIPTIPTPGAEIEANEGDKHPSVSYSPDNNEHFVDEEEEEEEGEEDANEEPSSGESDCPNSDPDQQARARTKIVNPIYIAVPVAGVCVLLALIIFAMYLLRRRTDYHHPHDSSYNSHHHYQHDHGGAAVTSAIKKGGGVGQLHQQQLFTGQQQQQQQHHANLVPHHCHCMCKKQATMALPPCSKGGNRCTDSERSSSGSETRLFLQS
ncbi:Bmp and activin membrane-bound inhibitor-like protein [Plakobranchus ocellatus]|uniref:Bmp and activin membrane-bound inhibitor-like protein n=1 Tax=Plakobranchus ocellatus TaxID=259542 RepID=A0AAV4D153_9GAST|nr:Bmp and activin membrane-bound inhibitor-like protein [Plakobranchus ocellatus]